MIELKDVRAGNWFLKITGKDAETNPFFEYRSIAVDENFYSFMKVCFPIVITPHVLGKCGFKHQFGDWYRNIAAEGIDEGLPFLRYRHESKEWYLKDIRIPSQPVYLHQLQNLLYALSGEELNVQLGFFDNLPIIGPVNFFVRPQAAEKRPAPML